MKDFLSPHRNKIDLNSLTTVNDTLEEDKKYTDPTTLKNFLIDSLMAIIEETK